MATKVVPGDGLKLVVTFPKKVLESSQADTSLISTIASKVLSYKSDLEHFEMAVTDNFRYRYVRVLGEGTYGVALLAFDNQAMKSIVIKISKARINNASLESEATNLKILNEVDPHHTVKFLRSKTIQVGVVRSQITSPRVFLFTEYGGIPVSETISDKVRLRPLSDFMHLFVQAISYWKALENKELVQRDIKPTNMLLNGPIESVGSLKIIDTSDLGNLNSPSKEIYVSTRDYRSPDVILKKFSSSEVPFAISASFYQLLTGRYLFISEQNVGESKNTRILRQLQAVFGTFGFPERSYFDEMPRDVFDQYFTEVPEEEGQDRGRIQFLKPLKDKFLVGSDQMAKCAFRIGKLRERILHATLYRFVPSVESVAQANIICCELENVFRALVVNRNITSADILQMPLFTRYQAIVDKHIKEPIPAPIPNDFQGLTG